MDGLIKPGDMLRMERAGAPLATEKRIGEGGQGVVHVARLNGAPFAVKWFRPGLGSDEMRTSITALIQRGRPPHPAFVWPIDLVSSDPLPGFGYVMPLLEPCFVSPAQLLNTERQPSFRVITTIGRELVDAFAALHSAGLCYRDISFGNLRVDPAAREAAIIDVDNVGVDGGSALVKGTGPFMAPELLRRGRAGSPPAGPFGAAQPHRQDLDGRPRRRGAQAGGPEPAAGRTADAHRFRPGPGSDPLGRCQRWHMTWSTRWYSAASTGSPYPPVWPAARMSAGVSAAMAWLTGSRPGRAVTIRTMVSSSPALSRANAAGAGPGGP